MDALQFNGSSGFGALMAPRLYLNGLRKLDETKSKEKQRSQNAPGGDSLELTGDNPTDLKRAGIAPQITAQTARMWEKGADRAKQYLTTLSFLDEFAPDQVEGFMQSLDEAIQNAGKSGDVKLKLDISLSKSQAAELNDENGSLNMSKSLDLSVHLELNMWQGAEGAGYDLSLDVNAHQESSYMMRTLSPEGGKTPDGWQSDYPEDAEPVPVWAFDTPVQADASIIPGGLAELMQNGKLQGQSAWDLIDSLIGRTPAAENEEDSMVAPLTDTMRQITGFGFDIEDVRTSLARMTELMGIKPSSNSAQS